MGTRFAGVLLGVVIAEEQHERFFATAGGARIPGPSGLVERYREELRRSGKWEYVDTPQSNELEEPCVLGYFIVVGGPPQVKSYKDMGLHNGEPGVQKLNRDSPAALALMSGVHTRGLFEEAQEKWKGFREFCEGAGVALEEAALYIVVDEESP